MGMWRMREGLASPLSSSPRHRVPQASSSTIPLQARRTMRFRASHGLLVTAGVVLPKARLLRWPALRRPVCSAARPPAVRPRVHAPHLELCRGAKTKSTAKLADLPQGALRLEPYDDGSDDVPRYPTVVQGHRNNMQKFKNCVILTRVGSFYEVRSARLFLPVTPGADGALDVL
ncbi:hypothetical protein VTN02DRAFT_3064 [Thermoascus thermophilus]